MRIDTALISREVQYTYQCCEQIFKIVPTIPPDELIRDFTALSASARPLTAGESGVITLLKPKTAALMADRVWLLYPGGEPPMDFAFGWQSPYAIRMSALVAFFRSSDFPPSTIITQGVDAYVGLTPNARKFLAFTEGDLVREYSQLTGAFLTPLYNSAQSRDSDYKVGNHSVVVSVIEGAAVVSEETLTWEQVVEFRIDREARSSYRRFVHWLDKEMLGKPASFIIDEVSGRMEAYSWALKKHGLQTVVGALERTLDAKSLLGTATAALTLEAMAGLPLLGILGGAGVLIGNAVVHVATRLIERADILAKNRDVAFVHEIRGRVGVSSQ